MTRKPQKWVKTIDKNQVNPHKSDFRGYLCGLRAILVAIRAGSKKTYFILNRFLYCYKFFEGTFFNYSFDT
jgi:hypothetical protein